MHFTLQLLGTYNKYSLVSFAKKHQLEKDTAYLATKRNGRNWYTLIHGRFTSRQQAQQAISNLPSALQKTKPWIRRFDGIQSTTHATEKTARDVSEPSQAATQPASLDLTAHAAWLWSQNPEHFTIQLLGSHNLDALRSFMQQHRLDKQTSFYRTRRDGQQWFVLLYGSYPDRNQAKAQIEKLPAAIRKTKPWPRRFVDIHTELTSQ
jgi:septal ring-binding cell division protein DamX